MKIKCVAIKIDDIVYHLPQPYRHCHIYWYLHKQGFKRPYGKTIVEGFLTEDNIFTNRQEAEVIAKAAGQIMRDGKMIASSVLTSEDLWDYTLPEKDIDSVFEKLQKNFPDGIHISAHKS